MQKILIPIDFSPVSRNALDFAINMWGVEDTLYILAHAYQLPPTSQDKVIQMNDSIKQKAEENLSQEVLSNTVLFQKGKYQLIANLGSLDGAIKRIAERESVNMIIIGSKRPKENSTLSVNYNSNSIVNLTNIPLLVVPEGFQQNFDNWNTTTYLNQVG